MKDYKKFLLIAVTALAILVTGLLCKQQFFLMVPLFVSLFVMAFQSEANRLGALIGAVNSIVYTVAYIIMGVYASAASAILFSFPIQLMTFLRWQKHKYKSTVVFKKMNTKIRIVFSLLILLAWALTAGVFYYLNYEYALFDSIMFLFGFIIPVLTMFAYIEYTYLWIVQAVIGLLLSIQMTVNDYKQATYLIYSVYSLYCIICAFVNVRKFYVEQNSNHK